MKKSGWFLFFLAFAFTITFIAQGIIGSYQYERDIASNWSIAEKASTIAKKSEYIDKFVKALNDAGLAGSYNALYLTTPDNSFDRNFEALLSLQNRFHSILIMDISSFQYQTAIQQITAQEQGEAKEMLQVFSGCWWKVHYFHLWNWVGTITIMVVIFLWVMSLTILWHGYDVTNRLL